MTRRKSKWSSYLCRRSYGITEGSVIQFAKSTGNENDVMKWIEGDQSNKVSMILAMAPSELKNVKNCKTSREMLFIRKLKESEDVCQYMNEVFDAVDN